ncbi:hypothetical protein CNBC3590 [Cryptococcus deneoformans B-3501A]|uniref:hypothetical protein n=1 Tax=Cryptococcus deneoformans (strain B-3501A) TaxID=283643 RepID=UPI000042FF0D|nr:hypothetical protein CNBC3590 [Cryptococcus neoformans var. neoformans B-3501A]EAL22221.1 hypothetical protein CNBC3590 [Cryptococcus neoformans var. neoformans B-3501A]
MSDRRKLAAPPGVGAGKPDHPFAVTVEDPVPNAIVPDGYGIKYHAYHTIAPNVQCRRLSYDITAWNETAGWCYGACELQLATSSMLISRLGTEKIVLDKVAKPGPPAAKVPPGPICSIQ